MSEHDETVAVVDWFRLQYPKVRIIAYPSGMWLGHDDNKRKYALINKFKKEGWLSGVSDLLICHSDGHNHGLWLEMKDVGKTFSSVSKEQRQWIEDMIKAGYFATWAAGFDKAKAVIADYMNGYYREE